MPCVGGSARSLKRPGGALVIGPHLLPPRVLWEKTVEVSFKVRQIHPRFIAFWDHCDAGYTTIVVRCATISRARTTWGYQAIRGDTGVEEGVSHDRLGSCPMNRRRIGCRPRLWSLGAGK